MVGSPEIQNISEFGHQLCCIAEKKSQSKSRVCQAVILFLFWRVLCQCQMRWQVVIISHFAVQIYTTLTRSRFVIEGTPNPRADHLRELGDSATRFVVVEAERKPSQKDAAAAKARVKIVKTLFRLQADAAAQNIMVNVTMAAAYRATMTADEIAVAIAPTPCPQPQVQGR